MFLRTLITITFILFPLAETSAQEVRGEFSGTDFSDSVSVSLEDYISACPSYETKACAYRTPEKSASCEFVALDSLGAAGGARYYMARYLSTTVFPDQTDGTWTCESDRAVLLEAAEEAPPGVRAAAGRIAERPSLGLDEQVVPVWRDATERTFEFIRAATLAEHNGIPLVSILYCLNGTGGCWDYVLIRDSSHWRPLEKDSTWETVYAQLPAGYRPHKSPPIDIEHLKWERHIASRNDANCCPSGRLLLDLDIVDGKLSVKRARLEADLSLEPD